MTSTWRGLARVFGKGRKWRTVCFGRRVRKALKHYTRHRKPELSDPVFRSERGEGHGQPLTRSGLRQLLERLGQMAQLSAVRCSPHTCRHTFAVNFLRNRGDVFALQTILGHSHLKMTQNTWPFRVPTSSSSTVSLHQWIK